MDFSSQAAKILVDAKAIWAQEKPSLLSFAITVYNACHDAVIAAAAIPVSGAAKKLLVTTAINELITLGLPVLVIPSWVVWAQRAIASYDLWAKARGWEIIPTDPQTVCILAADFLIERIYEKVIDPATATLPAATTPISLPPIQGTIT